MESVSVRFQAPSRPGRRIMALAVLLTLSLVAAACSSGATDGSGEQSAQDDQDAGADLTITEESDPDADLEELQLVVRPGPFQLAIDDRPESLSAAATVVALSTDGTELGSASFAENGTALFRELPAGPVDLQVVDGETRYRRQAVTVPGEEMDDPSFYEQTELPAGYTYITARDGTTLSAFVSLPGSATDGPYPTLVEYSGYSPSDPTASNDPYRLLIPALGYALVQVNVRGTGCSGGSFDAFERIQSLDGYDVIETVAAQSWSGNIGMFGVSYPGIMQLHVASTRPPSLSAIAPLSVTDGVQSVLYPGGIYNNGFGETWTQQVSDQAVSGGQDWAADRIVRGDQTCIANQAHRVHNPDLVDLIQTTPYVNELSIDRSAESHVDQIDVPVFLGGAWQDEQTGGRFPAILDELENAPVLRAVLYNGLHLDAISGEMLVKLIEYLNLYVGDRPPALDPVSRVLIGVGLSSLFGDDLELPSGRYEGMTNAEGREAFEADPPIEVLFEQGAEHPNLPVPGFRGQFEQWPPPSTEATTLYLAGQADGFSLSDQPPSEEATAQLTTRPEEGQETTIDDIGRIWTNEPGWNWDLGDSADTVTATTEALDEDLVMVGNLSADLWVSVGGEATDADLEVTVSEIAPDGSETYVQAGWLRLSRRALSAEATEFRPLISGLEADVAPLAPGQEPVLARVEILPFAHVFRTGSKLRITVDTPGGSRPQWRFDVLEDPVDVIIHSGPDTPSQVVLPIIPGFEVPTERPPCGSLRGQPCRQG